MSNDKPLKPISLDDMKELSDDTSIHIFGPDISAAVVCMDAVFMREGEKEALLNLYHECVKRMCEIEYANPYFETELKNIRPIINYFGRLPFTVGFYICIQ